MLSAEGFVINAFMHYPEVNLSPHESYFAVLHVKVDRSRMVMILECHILHTSAWMMFHAFLRPTLLSVLYRDKPSFRSCLAFSLTWGQITQHTDLGWIDGSRWPRNLSDTLDYAVYHLLNLKVCLWRLSIPSTEPTFKYAFWRSYCVFLSTGS
jgi:hypothetical protein